MCCPVFSDTDSDKWKAGSIPIADMGPEVVELELYTINLYT